MGVALAMSVFRAPFEDSYRRLGTILDREEALITGREDAAAVAHAEAVSSARTDWLIKRRDLEPLVAQHEKWIWASIVLSALGLVASALWPSVEMSREIAALVLILAVGPVVVGATRIIVDVRESLSVLSNKIGRL